jgi:hypothetical protein
MTDFFHRDGSPLEDSRVGLLGGGNIQVLRNTATDTTVEYLWDRPCTRCGGAGGADQWAHTGWKCFDCGGSGKHIHGAKRLKGYTAEKLAQLNATAEKAAATRAVKRAAKAEAVAAAAAATLDAKVAADPFLAKLRDFAPRDGILADMWQQVSVKNRDLTERQIEFAITLFERVVEDEAKAAEKVKVEAEQAEMNRSADYVGLVGDRIAIDGIVEDVIVFRSDFKHSYYDSGERRIIKIRQGSDLLVWFTSPCGIYKDHIGLPITGKGTVKKHELRDVPQTVLTRCKLQITEEAAA